LKNAVQYNLAVCLIYIITGYIGLMIAVPPGYATAIWPPYGIALGFVLVWGLKTIPGVFIGSFILNIYITFINVTNALNQLAIVAGLIVGVGTVLQVILGWWLVKFFIQLKNPLQLPKDILIFALLTGPVSCVVAATIGNIGLYFIAILPSQNLLTSWVTWWVGDSISALIFTPVFLIVFAQPAKLWRSRITPILIPLCIVFITIVFAYFFYRQSEIKRVQSEFMETTKYKLHQLTDKLNLTTEMGRELAFFLALKPSITNADFQYLGGNLLQRNSIIQSVQWVPKVTNRNDFNKIHQIKITDKSTGQYYPEKNKSEYYPVLFSLSKSEDTLPIGYDLLSNPNLSKIIKQRIQDKSPFFSMVLTKKGEITKVFIASAIYMKGELAGLLVLQINLLDLFKDTFDNFVNYSNLTIQQESNHSTPNAVYKIYENTEYLNTNRLIHISLSHSFLGELWNIQAISSLYFINYEYSWQLWLSLTTTLLFCVLMNIILFILYGQRYLIESLANARSLQLQTEKAKTKLLLNATGEGILWIDANYNISFINTVAENLLGYSNDELKEEPIYKILFEKALNEISPPLESLSVYKAISEKMVIKTNESVFWRKDHSYFWVEYTCIPIIIKKTVKGAAIIFSDISERLENGIKLAKMAHTDPLTKLPNRLSFFDFLEHAIARAQRNKKQFAICFIDVDNFKFINDTFGHVSGDKFLSILSGLIRAQLRDTDYFARIGGDEFGLIFEEAYQTHDLIKILKRILMTFDKPILIDNQYMKASLSIGISIYPKNGKDPETLFKNADIAMYQAKELGKSTFSFYSEYANERALKYNQIELALLQAIREKRYHVFYQPMVHTVSRKIVGVEALLRWEDEMLKSLPLVESLLIAEDRGIIYELGQLILQLSFNEYQEISKNRPNLHLAINISIKQLESTSFTTLVKDLLNQYQINPKKIYFEIKEAYFIKDPDKIISNMMVISNFGIRFVLDNFGTGYSSVHLLKKLPLSFLKIDRTFISELEKKTDDATIALTTIQLSHGLGMKSIAEGVENVEQLELLKKWGCAIAQGYYFAQPMPLNELLVWMTKYEKSLKQKSSET